MTYSARKRVRVMEYELSRWWELSQRGWCLVRTDPTNEELAEIKDEVEVMAVHTDWVTLRTAMTKGLAYHDAHGLPSFPKEVVA